MSGAYRRIWAILRREYALRVRNRWFVITTAGLPLLMLGFMLVPVWLAGPGDDVEEETLRIGIVDRAGPGAPDLARRVEEVVVDPGGAAGAKTGTSDTHRLLEEPELAPGPTAGPGGRVTGPRIRLRAEPVGLDPALPREAIADSLRRRAVHDAFLVLPGPAEEGEPAVLLSRESVGESVREALDRVVRSADLEARLRAAGLPEASAANLARRGPGGLRVERLDGPGLAADEIVAFLAVLLTFVLYMMFIIYGQSIVRGVLEEKTSDVVEILVSSVRPWEMMVGKIVGIGAVGLTQVAIWAGAGAVVFSFLLAGSAPALAEAGIDLTGVSLPLGTVAAAFLAFFLLGYLLYAACFAAAGAIVGDDQDAQYANFPLILLIGAAFVLSFAVIEDPAAGWAVPLSLIPFFSPILMLVRITLEAAAAWEVVLSLVLLVATAGGVAWLAGRIYRVGILMKGKRANLPEVIRWVRYG